MCDVGPGMSHLGIRGTCGSGKMSDDTCDALQSSEEKLLWTVVSGIRPAPEQGFDSFPGSSPVFLQAS